MANRLATQTDVDNFQTNYPNEYARSLIDPDYDAMTLNDIIIDTPTNTTGNLLYYNDMDTRFSGARTGFTLWMKESEGIPKGHSRLYTAALWAKSTSNNPVKIRPLGGQYGCRRNVNTPSTATFHPLEGVEYLLFDGWSSGYEGLNSAGAHRDKFGFFSDSYGRDSTGAQMLSFNDQNLKGLEIKNFQALHGFSAIRILDNNPPANYTMDYLKISNIYLADGQNGEGFYIGITGGEPFGRIADVELRNFIISRRAAENIQLQHFMRGTNSNVVENFVSYAGAMDRYAPFQGGQSNNLQVLYDEGTTVIRNGIIWGTLANYLILMAGTTGSPLAADRVRFENVLMMGTGNRGIYVQSNETIGTIDLNKVTFGDSYAGWDEIELATAADHHVFMENHINMVLRNSKYKNNKTLITNSLNNTQTLNNNSLTTVAAPQFKSYVVNPEDMHNWKAAFGSAVAATGSISYPLNRIVFNDLVDQLYYYCIVAHSSTASDPSIDTTNWAKCTWDTNGYPVFHANHNALDTQSDYPVEDFRLVANNEYNILGMGIDTNEKNTSKSFYQWYAADDGNGTNERLIPKFKTLRVDETELVSVIGSGKSVRCKATIASDSGITVKNSGWFTL